MNSFDWARHKREKAGAKLHLTFDLGNRLSSFAIVEDAARHDSVRAAELTAHLKARDIAVADRAYTDFGFMNGLDRAGRIWSVQGSGTPRQAWLNYHDERNMNHKRTEM